MASCSRLRTSKMEAVITKLRSGVRFICMYVCMYVHTQAVLYRMLRGNNALLSRNSLVWYMA